MKKPNILLFMTDQQHVETIGNDKLCYTPKLNAYMEQGVVFTNAYTNCPMCTPARATAMTGLHPHQHMLIQNAHSKFAARNQLEPHMETIGSALKQEGYTTIQAGKWHVGKSQPEQHGFDKKLKHRPAPGEVVKSDRVVIKDRFGEHVLASTTDYDRSEAEVFRVAEAVNSWLDNRAEQGQEEPFFLFASCIEPHVPWHVPEPYASMYDPEQYEEWENYRDDYQDKPLTFGKHYYDVNYCRIRNDWPKMAKALAKYYGLVTMVDDAFGLMMEKLEQHGLLENTIVMFTSDHGELMGRHGLVGKNELMLDDLIRIPLVVYGKDRFASRKVEHPVLLSDLFNTVMELTGSPQREQLDSMSFAPLLHGDSGPAARTEVVMEHHGATINMNVVRAIRGERYKYVYRPHEIDEFYDLADDPAELHNRIGDPACRELVWELRGRLLAWSERTEDFALEGMQRSFANPDPVEFQ